MGVSENKGRPYFGVLMIRIHQVTILGSSIFGKAHVAAAPYGSLDCWKSVGLEGLSSKESRYVEHSTRACGVNLSLTTTPPPGYQSRFICWKPLN